MSYYQPDVPFEFVLPMNNHGAFITVEGDVRQYFMMPGQRFIPHTIEDTTHPAKVGDIVTLTDWLATRLGTNVAFVSGVRTFKDSRRSNGNRQVELLGLPGQWFAVGHFEEYQGITIYDHIWGDLNRQYVKPITITDNTGTLRTGKPVLPIVLPNL